MFPLLLVEVFARLGLNVGLDLQQLSFLGKHLVELVEAVLDVVDIEQFLFLGGRQRYVGPQEINQVVGIVDVANGKDELFGLFAYILQQLEGKVLQGRYQSLELLVVGLGHDFVFERHIGAHVGEGLGHLVDSEPFHFPLQDYRRAVVGHFEYLDDFAHDTHLVEVVAARVLDRGVALAYHADGGVVVLCVLDQLQRLGPAHVHRDCYAREQYHVAQGEYRQPFGV